MHMHMWSRKHGKVVILVNDLPIARLFGPALGRADTMPPWWAALAPKFMIGGGVAVGWAGRRALTPFLIMGTAVTSAGWFGAFEACFSFSKLMMPVPVKADSSAQTTGVATIPCVLGLFSFAGWRTCPLLEAPPKEISNIGGWLKYGGSLPLRHVGTFGLASAAAAAVSCRAVQYRGGA